MAQPLITVVDDDPDVRDALLMILKKADYRVNLCATGPQAVESIHREKPDVILLDVMLASPSEGFHLAYEFRGDESVRDVPIIMISAIGKKMGMDYARELGSDYLPVERFLDKPLEAVTVLAAVSEVLAHRRQHVES